MKNRRKAVQPFEIKKRKIDIFRNYEAYGFGKNQRKFENFSTLISKKSNEKDLIKELTSILSKHCQVDPIYLDRMKKTFPIKDGKNCERLFKSIYSKD